ncbi:MAG: hypothetical protein QG635_2393 [Bacteroidota bacterium]|nr:hypothetical protein [Bacteroidota bacterium]
MEIKKAYSEDFKKISQLFTLFNDREPIDSWRNLFSKQWNSDYNYHGYYIEENCEAVGFLGLIFADRVIDSKPYTFCNMTSWVVIPEYRQHSLSLMFQILAEDKLVITNLTPNPNLFEILKHTGFQIIDNFLVFTFPLKFIGSSKLQFISDIEQISSMLDKYSLCLIREHEHSKAKPFLIEVKREQCLIFASPIRKKRIPVSQVLYVNNPKMFKKHIHLITRNICRSQSTLAMLTAEHFLEGEKPLLSVKFNRQTFFMGPNELQNKLDFLYSELA